MSSVAPVVGSALASVMIAVRRPDKTQSAADMQLQAEIERLAMALYIKAHCDAPPSATDFGGGIYNVLI